MFADLNIVNGSGWPKFPKNHFRGKLLVSFSMKELHIQDEGPFEANTSHPILLIGNTAGVYNCCLVNEIWN
jgi:hypothetical protein